VHFRAVSRNPLQRALLPPITDPDPPTGLTKT
jgi:hypothetical protein